MRGSILEVMSLNQNLKCLLMALALSVGACVEAFGSNCVSNGDPAKPADQQVASVDPVGPFPLSTPLPFPWGSITGIWTLKAPPNGTHLNLSLEVLSDCDGRKFIEVIAFDAKTFEPVGRGVGLSQADDTLVRAVISSGPSSFMLYIRQFKASAKVGGSATVMTVRQFTGGAPGVSEGADFHVVARKLSSMTLDAYAKRMLGSGRRRGGQPETR